MIFGDEMNKGIVLNGFKLEVVSGDTWEKME